MSEQRRLAAILVADVVGYSKLVGSDEAGTLAKLSALRSLVIEPAITKRAGRLFKAMGDGFLVEFASAVQAVEAARAIQHANAEGELPLRIGIHVGDVVVQGDDLMGDGVNIAARIEGAADPGGIAISRQVRDQVRDKLDVALIDKGEVELKNIARPVRVFLVAGAKAPAQAQANVLALPDKPSIAVLPFENMSGDPEQEYFADGMVEDIITALSRFKSLFVIARNSSFTYKGQAIDIKQVGRELGVRYVLEGSVRKAANTVRITGQLIDAETGTHLWADRFDGPLKDIFELQDRMTMTVVGAIAPKLEKAEIDRAKRKPVESLDAYDCFLRGMAEVYRQTFESWEAALRLFYRAIELDPDFAAPYAMATRCYAAFRQFGRGTDKHQAEVETRRLVTQVTTVGGEDALAVCWAGYGLAHVCGDNDTGAALIDRGLAINENLAVGWQLRALVGLWQGRYEEVIEWVARAKRLNPVDPEAFRSETLLALVSIAHGDYGKAVRWSTKVVMQAPNWPPGLWVAASANALAGNKVDAEVLVNRVRDLVPGASVSLYQRVTPASKPLVRDKLIEGLRLAGVPE